MAQSQVTHTHADLQKYQGSYRFPDGTIITGGRMDEGGRVMLSYLDTQSVSRGGVFNASDGEFAGLYGTQASIDFVKDGDVMFWNANGEEPVRVERIMKPETRPAAFKNGDVHLEGTLYLPPGASGKVPAVVLAHGSGPTTRYLGPWVTFFVAEGFAVLAFDKRGTGESEGDWQRSTYFDLSADLVAAAKWLSGQAYIDATRIGLKTSSQSGWYGPSTVEKSNVFAFLIQRAAPAVDIAVGTAHEIRYELAADGVAPHDIDTAVDFWLELHEMARSGASLESANEYLGAARGAAWFKQSFGDWDAITPLWWHQHTINLKLDPAASTARLDEPVLWFLAENDENVPYRASIEALESAKETKADLSIITVHNVGHSFFISDGDEGMRYTDEYWTNMAQWMDENVVSQPVTTDR
jgi:alpha-beta hydrolase superfamily lysophospholipase